MPGYEPPDAKWLQDFTCDSSLTYQCTSVSSRQIPEGGASRYPRGEDTHCSCGGRHTTGRRFWHLFQVQRVLTKYLVPLHHAKLFQCKRVSLRSSAILLGVDFRKLTPLSRCSSRGLTVLS
jgi:hypothetical protein